MNNIRIYPILDRIIRYLPDIDDITFVFDIRLRYLFYYAYPKKNYGYPSNYPDKCSYLFGRTDSRINIRTVFIHNIEQEREGEARTRQTGGGSELIRAGGERKEFGGGGDARDRQVAHSPRALVGAVQVQLLVSVCSSCVTQCISEAQSTNGARIIASLQLWMKTVRIFIRPSVRPNKYEHLFG